MPCVSLARAVRTERLRLAALPYNTGLGQSYQGHQARRLPLECWARPEASRGRLSRSRGGDCAGLEATGGRG